MLFSEPDNPQKLPPPTRGGSRTHLIHAHTSQLSKPHLDRFSRFCRAYERDKQTDTQTTLLRL